jgi:TPR repeat protein
MTDDTVSALLTRARAVIEAGDTTTATDAWNQAESLAGLTDVSVRDRPDAATSMPDGLSWSLWGAANGNASAMFAAACCYRDAVGTRRNGVQAVRWYLAMLSTGDGDGVYGAITLAKHMSEAHIREAGRLAGRENDAAALLESTDRPSWRRPLRPSDTTPPKKAQRP